MIGLIIALHVIICALLIVIILIQAGRGGGLVNSFSGVESMFGTKTNTFLTRTTTTLAILFFITCISLALISARQSKSLMSSIKTEAPKKEEKAAVPAIPAAQKEEPQSPAKEETRKSE